MQLQSDLWIEGPYHIDFSPSGELRIVGRGNHIYLGLAGIRRRDLEIERVVRRGERLHVYGRFSSGDVKLLDPVVRSVRKVRELSEREIADRTFEELIRGFYAQVAPNEVGFEIERGRPTLKYRRRYGEEWYGVRFIFPKSVEVTRSASEPAFLLRCESPIEFQIVAESSLSGKSTEQAPLIRPGVIDLGRFRDRADFIQHLFTRTAIEISHLITHDKTSGYEYGTIFPRDWMESADLSEGDLSSQAIDYMYQKALGNVSPEGVGWHENLVGESEYEAEEVRRSVMDSIRETPLAKLPSRALDIVTAEKQGLISRQMVDIEPRYLMGLDRVSEGFWEDERVRENLRRVAEFFLAEARSKSLITFREKPHHLRRHRDDLYFEVGTWRDGRGSFAGAEDPIAPFDVNAVFYPAALRALERHRGRLGLEIGDIGELIAKWDAVESRFRYRTKEGRPAYALALSGALDRGEMSLAQRLEIGHTDEAYLLAYGEPDRTVVRSFVERLLDPAHFYTPSGPTVVEQGSSLFSTKTYQGHVIWTKQTAYCSLGICRSLTRAREEGWPAEDIQLLEEGLRMIFATSLRAFSELGGIPELHYDHDGTARFYDDQSDPEGQMSKVQLWSAVGARRIIRDYHELAGGQVRG